MRFLFGHIGVLFVFVLVCVCVCVKYMMCVVGSGLGMSQSSRLSSSVSAMRVLNTGSDVEEALADALVNIYTETLYMYI